MESIFVYLGIRGINMKKEKQNNQGFTLVELLVAMAVGLVVLAAIFYTFKSQQDSYVVQSQVAVAQQNVRAAMYMISRDIQMAGYYTNFETVTITMDWDDMGGDEAMRPLIYARDNIAGSGDGIKDDTDLIVIVKASMENGRQLASGEDASGDNANLTVVGSLTKDRYGLLVKEDLSRAEFFEIRDVTGTTLTLSKTLVETYTDGDWIFRADIIIYYVSDTDPQHPSLMRQNLGNNEAAQVVAEDIDNLQLRYLLNNGNMVDSGFNGSEVRAVEIAILTRTPNIIRGYTDPNTYNIGGQDLSFPDGYRRRLLKALIKTRNVGL